MKIGGVDFNEKYANSVTEEEFVSHFSSTSIWEDNPKRVEEFKKAWTMLTKKKKKED